MSTDAQSPETSPKQWQPLSSIQRRVIGVLIEKAKTTPDSYPLTLNALTNGCNQKSNRSPQMNLSSEDVEEALEQLREMGAIAELQGGGRVPKFRHYMYDWLGVDKVELAVMGELLLRGEQSIGELRGRAARMEPIADLSALRPLVESLQQKELVISLTPAGRGQIVTHNLYTPERRQELCDQYATRGPSAHRPSASSSGGRQTAASGALEQLQNEVAQLRAEVAQLREQLEHLVAGSPAAASRSTTTPTGEDVSG